MKQTWIKIEDQNGDEQFYQLPLEVNGTVAEPSKWLYRLTVLTGIMFVAVLIFAIFVCLWG
jgi:hypothetical protein